jgi:hypothetical protein
VQKHKWKRGTQMLRVRPGIHLRDIQKVLLSHHRKSPGQQAHPQGGFLVPEWNGPIAFSGAAILGHAPTWDL